MKRLILKAAVVLSLLAGAAHAGSCNPYPYTLVNGQLADANQVMADFNLIRNCALNNLASNGANSDITSLNGLLTPLSVAQGGTGNTSGTSPTATALTPGGTIAMTGDVTYTSPTFTGANITAAGTLATVNGSPGSFANATLTVNGKGLVTAASASPAGTTSVAGPVPLATGAQVITGTDTTHATTPASLTTQQSLATSGYYTLPGGLIVEWASLSSVPGGSNAETFPFTFPSAVLSVVLCPTTNLIGAGGQFQDGVNSVTTSGFNLVNNSANVRNYYWMAIGK